MANIINKRINNTNNTKGDASMENKIMYIQQAYSIDTMLPGGGFFGGEQTDVLPGGGFHGGEQTDVLPGGGFHGGEQTDVLPGGGFYGGEQTDVLPGGGFHGGEQTDVLPGDGFHGDLIPSQETSNDVKTDETPPWMTGVYGVDWFFS